MKYEISKNQARECSFEKLINIVATEPKSDIELYKEQFYKTLSEYWWKLVARKCSIERMIELFEEKYDDDFKIIRVKGGWKVSTINNFSITSELVDALFNIFKIEFIEQ